MKINPTQFAFYLKSSSLSSVEQTAILNRLPYLNETQIKTLFDQLKMDHQAMSKVLKTAQAKRDRITSDLEASL